MKQYLTEEIVKKILKSLVVAMMIVSAAIVTASTPTTTHAASGDWRKGLSIGWWYREFGRQLPKEQMGEDWRQMVLLRWAWIYHSQ